MTDIADPSDIARMDDMRKRLVDWYDAAARIQNQYFGHTFTEPVVEMLRRALQDAIGDVGLGNHFVVLARTTPDRKEASVMPAPISLEARRYVALVKARRLGTLAPPTLTPATPRQR